MAALIAGAVSAFSTPARAESDLAGRWSGNYNCGIETTMTLEVSEKDGLLDGVFSFDAQGQSGSYRMAGRLQPDRRFTFVPREWIKRPDGFTALGITGILNENNRLIEGRLSPCMPGDFKAARAMPEAERSAAMAPPQPLQTGALSGIWAGGIGCRMNRRGNTETYPLELQVIADGDGVGAFGHIRIYKKRNSGAGPAFDQFMLLSGRQDGTSLTLENPLMVDRGGAQAQLKGLAGNIGTDSIEGQVSMSGCETVSLKRKGALQQVAVPATLAGTWMGTAGRQNETSVILHAMPDADPPFFELQATYPANLPDAERDRLRLALVPVVEQDGRLLLMPVSRREATGVFGTGSGPVRHALGQWRGVLVSAGSNESVELRGLARESDVAAAAGSPQALQNTIRLTRPTKQQQEAVASGEAPPIDFGGSIAGALAAAPSREAQCRVLETWLKPFEGGLNIDRMSLDAVLAGLIGAFADEAFEPVFGLPFLLTIQEERGAVARLIRDTCRSAMRMRMVGVVGDFVLSTEHQFTGMTTLMADRTETGGWMARLQEELRDLPQDQSGLDRINGMRADMAKRRRDLTDTQAKEVEAAIARRENDVKLAMLLAEVAALPETGFEQGNLNRVFALLKRAQASGLDNQSLGKLREGAEAKARSLLDGPLREAAGLAATLPMSLEGMRLGNEAMGRFRPYRRGMEEWFGTIDGAGVLHPLYSRLEEIRNDAGVKSAFREKLLEVATGPDAEAIVRNTAAAYVEPEETHRYPEYAALIDEVALVAEVRAISIVDDSGSPQPGEPTAEEIARFALQRVRDYNAQQAAKDDACLSGQVSDPVQAMLCLTSPALYTGQKGFGARLIAVRKIGCVPEVSDIQYRCTFTQEIQINMPGGEAYGGNTLSQMARQMSSGEAVDARFSRAAGGGWNIVWGDLQ
ncbi:hypothetical protein [Borborobacter arsenicus]|nr:hypothetical protein [Pseudaminobacter arsenicus]